MESNFDPIMVREKFATLIARLHQIGFTDDLITNKIISHPYFSLFENNEYLDFLNTPIETIISAVFRKDNVTIDYNKPVLSEYYWAGLMYFNILNECHIPLERIFIIWPLREMLKKYNPYHEMPNNALYEDYLKAEMDIGLLKALKKINALSLREISILTRISENTLKSYYDNERLFNATFENINRIAQAFDVKIHVFKKSSNFIMGSNYLMQDDSFLKMLKIQLCHYFDVDDEVTVVVSYKSETELIKIGKKVKQFIYLPDFAFVKYNRRLEYKFLKDNEIKMIMLNALQLKN